MTKKIHPHSIQALITRGYSTIHSEIKDGQQVCFVPVRQVDQEIAELLKELHDFKQQAEVLGTMFQVPKQGVQFKDGFNAGLDYGLAMWSEALNKLKDRYEQQ